MKEDNLSKYDPFSENYDPSLGPLKPFVAQKCPICDDMFNGDLIEKIHDLLDGRVLICLIVHGSHLYGLNHEDSDIDIKGVFMPSKRDYLLCDVPVTLKYTSGNDDSKNSKDDVDLELYSLNHFFKLAASGDTGAISMMNASKDMVCFSNYIWEKILEYPGIFYSKNMAGLIGFVLTQTSKYCQKGDRLAAAKEAQNFFEASDPESKLREYWGALPTGEYLSHVEKDGNRFYDVCGRMIQDTSSAKYALGVINSITKSYGNRAKTAHDNNGLDWKAISHAFRVASELSNLYEFGKINYPLDDFERIKRMKMGELDFKTEVLPDLNSLMDRVHEMSQKSHFPEKVNQEKIDNLLYSLIKSNIS